MKPGHEPNRTVLEIDDLCVTYTTRAATVHAVDGVSMHVRAGSVVGVVGESGSGKTSIASAVLGMLGPRTRVQGRISLGSDDLLGASPNRMRALLGRRMALVPQNPMSSMTPVLTVGRQLTEAVRAHRRTSAEDAREIARGALERVRVPDARRVLDQYPHELSGGTRQRILIAMALLHEPELVVADEPTSALDATVQRQIVDLLAEVVDTTGAALLLISHDLALVSQLADDICVMFAGQVVEAGPADSILREPRHPYTAVLLAAARDELDTPDESRPSTTSSTDSTTAASTTADTTTADTTTCRFRPRCPRALDACATRTPAMVPLGTAHAARCLLLEEVPR